MEPIPILVKIHVWLVTKMQHFYRAGTERVQSTYRARTEHVRSTLGKHSKSELLVTFKRLNKKTLIFQNEKLTFTVFSQCALYVLCTCSVCALYVLCTCFVEVRNLSKMLGRKRHASDHHRIWPKRMHWQKWQLINHHNTSSTRRPWQQWQPIDHPNMSSTRMHLLAQRVASKFLLSRIACGFLIHLFFGRLLRIVVHSARFSISSSSKGFSFNL